MTRQVSWV